MKITKNQIDAMADILKMIMPFIEKRTSDSDSIEPISALAILSGSFLFRSFEFQLDNSNPGEIINRHTEAEQSKEKELIILTHSSLELTGIITDLNMLPPHKIEHRKNYFIDIIGKIQEPAFQIMKKHSLNYEQLAQSAVIATSYFIRQRERISVEDGLKTAIYYYFVGSRTYPPDFS
jgi:hypothetical protein